MTPIHIRTPDEKEIRAAVQYAVGAQHMRDFELWAFRRSPVEYHEGTPALYEMSHSTKCVLPENHIEAIAEIINLWKRANT